MQAGTELIDPRRVVERLEHRGARGHPTEQPDALPLRASRRIRQEPDVRGLSVGDDLVLGVNEAPRREGGARDPFGELVKAKSHEHRDNISEVNGKVDIAK